MIDLLFYKGWVIFICKSKLIKCWLVLVLNLTFNNLCFIYIKEILKCFFELYEESLRYGNILVLLIII